MPKRRYQIMTRLHAEGRHARPRHDVPHLHGAGEPRLRFAKPTWSRSCASSLALQPIATALFANSPFTEGKPNGFLSFRSEIWRDTDNDRAGMLPLAFEDGMGFERYVDYALDVPMYFVKRGDDYIDVAGKSFRDLLAGKLDGMPGERATISDWANHLTTIFPGGAAQALPRDARRRSAAVARAAALPAFWVGLLYDEPALDAAWDIVKDWTAEERQKLRDDVPRLGFKATIRGRSVLDLARETLALARAGTCAPRASSTATAMTRRGTSRRWKRSSRAA